MYLYLSILVSILGTTRSLVVQNCGYIEKSTSTNFNFCLCCLLIVLVLSWCKKIVFLEWLQDLIPFIYLNFQLIYNLSLFTAFYTTDNAIAQWTNVKHVWTHVGFLIIKISPIYMLLVDWDSFMFSFNILISSILDINYWDNTIIFIL